MEYFYAAYNKKNYADLKKRFGFAQDAQIDSMYSYLEYLRSNQLNFEQYGEGYNYKKNVLGQLMHKYINQSYPIIEEVLALEITARNFARYAYETNLICPDYVSKAISDPYTVGQICYDINLYDVEEIKLLINGTWYNDYSTLISRGFTKDELITFYNSSDPEQFGYQLRNQTTLISAQYGCVDYFNCTAAELATKQWTHQTVTLNPYQADPIYTPVSESMAYWGAYPTPQLDYNVISAPEFSICTDETSVSDVSLAYMMDTQFGLNNELIAIQFAEFVSNSHNIA